MNYEVDKYYLCVIDGELEVWQCYKNYQDQICFTKLRRGEWEYLFPHRFDFIHPIPLEKP